jgi:hypothetical protein
MIISIRRGNVNTLQSKKTKSTISSNMLLAVQDHLVSLSKGDDDPPQPTVLEEIVKVIPKCCHGLGSFHSSRSKVSFKILTFQAFQQVTHYLFYQSRKAT